MRSEFINHNKLLHATVSNDGAGSDRTLMTDYHVAPLGA